MYTNNFDVLSASEYYNEERNILRSALNVFMDEAKQLNKSGDKLKLQHKKKELTLTLKRLTKVSGECGFLYTTINNVPLPLIDKPSMWDTFDKQSQLNWLHDQFASQEGSMFALIRMKNLSREKALDDETIESMQRQILEYTDKLNKEIKILEAELRIY